MTAMRHRWGLTGVTAVVMVSLVVVGSPRPGATPSRGVRPTAGFLDKNVGSPDYSFGGYLSYQTIKQISAEWRVPEISVKSPEGLASTWVGAQGGANAFIQLGTTEDKFSATGPSQYVAFWSDPKKGFHPQTLLTIHANDLVRATMRRTAHGWRLSFSDLTANTTAPTFSTYVNDDHFNEGEFLQEDPAYSLPSAVNESYPEMAGVTFSDLRVNRAMPRLPYDQAQSLQTLQGAFFVPTHVVHDSFSLIPAQGAALQLLSDLHLYQSALVQFYEYPRKKLVDVYPYAASLNGSIHVLTEQLTSQRWPRGVSADIHAIRTRASRLDQLVGALQNSPTKDLARRLAAVLSGIFNLDLKTAAAKTALGLPNGN